VPARQAYSHWASVGRRYSQPGGSRPAFRSCSVSTWQNLPASSHETCSTGSLSTSTPAANAASRASRGKELGLSFITWRYSPCVTSHLPSQNPRESATSTWFGGSSILNSPVGHQRNF